MELFNLLAKLTLDSTDFEKGLDDAQREAESFQPPEEQKLELDNSDFNSSLDESKGKGSEFETGMTDIFKGIKTALTVTGIVAAVSSVVNGIKEAVNLTAQTADQIDKGSKRLGISTKAYQEWDHALRQSGAGINDLQKGVIQFNKYIAGDKTDEMVEAFKALGVNANEAGMTTEKLMDKTLVALAKFKENGGTDEERGMLVTALFGKGGLSLNALLDEGEEGVKNLLSEAGDLGLIMSEDEISNAVAYGDAVANLNSELAAIKTAFVADIIPVLKSGADFLTQILQAFNPRLRENALSETFQSLDEKATKSLGTLESNKKMAEALIEKLSGMGDYWTLDEKGKKTYDALAAELIELFPMLDEVIKEDKNAIHNNTQEILKNIDAWTKLEQQRILDQNLADKREKIAEKYAAALDKEVEAEVKETEANSKKSAAIDAMNQALEDNALLREQFEQEFGASSVNADNADNALSWYLNDSNHYVVGGEEEVQAFLDLQEQAENLRAEAERMEKEAEDAQKEYTKYADQLALKMGVTLSDTESVTNQVVELKKQLQELPSEVRIYLGPVQGFTHAIGSEYIPYDNYPALLHRGEKVLTAAQARQESKQVDLTGLEDRIANAIKAGMKDVTVESYLDGSKVTDKVSRDMARQLADRRYG